MVDNGAATTSETTCVQCDPPKSFPTTKALKGHNTSCHPHAQQLICRNRDCALAGQVQASLGCFNRHIGDYHAPISRRTCNLAKCTSRGKVFDTPSDMFVHELEPVHRENPNPEPITNWICQVPGCTKFGIPFLSTNHILTTSTAPKDAVARTMHAMSFVPTVDACHLIPSSNALDFGANTCWSALSVSALRRPLRIRGPAKIKPAKHIINPS
jgi:hypothetical protein